MAPAAKVAPSPSAVTGPQAKLESAPAKPCRVTYAESGQREMGAPDVEGKPRVVGELLTFDAWDTAHFEAQREGKTPDFGLAPMTKAAARASEGAKTDEDAIVVPYADSEVTYTFDATGRATSARVDSVGNSMDYVFEYSYDCAT